MTTPTPQPLAVPSDLIRQAIAALESAESSSNRDSGLAVLRAMLDPSAPAQPAPAEHASSFNDWFSTLPEGRRAVLQDDKWMFAEAAYNAALAQPTPATAAGLQEVDRAALSLGLCKTATVAERNHANKVLYRLSYPAATAAASGLTDEQILTKAGRNGMWGLTKQDGSGVPNIDGNRVIKTVRDCLAAPQATAQGAGEPKGETMSDYANRMRWGGEPNPPAASAAQGLSDAQVDAAAKVLAERMDYPWQHMPEQGRKSMREHATAVIEAARASQPTGGAK